MTGIEKSFSVPWRTMTSRSTPNRASTNPQPKGNRPQGTKFLCLNLFDILVAHLCSHHVKTGGSFFLWQIPRFQRFGSE